MTDMSRPATRVSPIYGWLTAQTQLVLLVTLVALCLLISLAAPQFYSVDNIIAIFRQTALVLIVAIGMTMLLISAEVDLSVGASLAFAGVVAMDVTNKTSNVALGVLAGILFGGGVGLVNGLLVTRLRINSLIATIATMMILQGSVYLYSREAVQNKHLQPLFTWLSTGYVGPFPLPVLVTAVLFVIGYVVLRHTTLGRYIYATGANVKAARLSGIRPERIKMLVFVVTGLLTGLVGVILCSLMNAGQPTAGRGFELTVVAAVILGGTSLTGGRGTLLGTLLGVLILKVIDNGIIILRWDQDLQMVIPGLIIVIASYIDLVRKKSHAS